MRIATLIAALAVSAIGLAGCGGDDNAADAVTTTATTTTATTTKTTDTGGETTPTAPAAQAKVITIRVVGGQPQGGIARDSVAQGRDVVITVTSDVADEVHVHGYDLMADVAPGAPATIRFTADAPGRFEIELENSAVQIAELEVRP